MAINWQTMELNMKNYLEAGKNDATRTRKSVAKMLQTFYIQEVQSGATDIFQNPIISITVSEGVGLSKSLEDGFNSSFNTNTNQLLNQTGMRGAIDHWNGAQLAPLIPAPGMAFGVNNSVTMPGSIYPMNLIRISATEDLLAKELVRVLKLHAQSIQGLYSGVTPAGTAIVIPWVGIL